MNSGKQMLWTLAVFVLGLVLGASVINQYHKKYLASMVEGGTSAFHEHMKRKFMADLDLDQAQRERMEPLMTELHEKIRAIRRQAEPEIKKLFEEAKPGILDLLRPDQVQKFKEMEAKRKRRHESANATKS